MLQPPNVIEGVVIPVVKTGLSSGAVNAKLLLILVLAVAQVPPEETGNICPKDVNPHNTKVKIPIIFFHVIFIFKIHLALFYYLSCIRNLLCHQENKKTTV